MSHTPSGIHKQNTSMQSKHLNEDSYRGKLHVANSDRLIQTNKGNHSGNRVRSRSSTPVSHESSFQKNKSGQHENSGQGLSSDSRKKGKNQRGPTDVGFTTKPESFKKVKSSRELLTQNSPILPSIFGGDFNSDTSLDNKISAWYALAPVEGNRKDFIGSGQLHRKGKNYKPVDERHMAIQKEDRSASRRKGAAQRSGITYPASSSASGFVWQDESNKTSAQSHRAPLDSSKSEETKRPPESKQSSPAIPKSEYNVSSGVAITSKLRVDCPEFKPSLSFDFSKLNLNSKKSTAVFSGPDSSSSTKNDEKKSGKRGMNDTSSSTPTEDSSPTLNTPSTSITTSSATVATPKSPGISTSSSWNLNAPTFTPTLFTPPMSNQYARTSSEYSNQKTFQYASETNFPYDTAFNEPQTRDEDCLYETSKFDYPGINYQELDGLNDPVDHTVLSQCPSSGVSQDIVFVYGREFEDEAVYPTPEEEYGYPTNKCEFDYNRQPAAEIELRPSSPQAVLKQSASTKKDGLPIPNSHDLTKDVIKQTEFMVFEIELKDGSVRLIEIHPNDDLESKARQFCITWNIPGNKIVQRLARRLAQEQESH